MLNVGTEHLLVISRSVFSLVDNRTSARICTQVTLSHHMCKIAGTSQSLQIWAIYIDPKCAVI